MTEIILTIIFLVAVLLHIWKYSNYSTKKKIVMTVLLAVLTYAAPLLVFVAVCYWYRRFMPAIVGLFAVYLLFAFLFSKLCWDFNGIFLLFEATSKYRMMAWITFIGILSLALSLYPPIKQYVVTKLPVLKQYGLSPLLYIIPACMILLLPTVATYELRIDLDKQETTFIMMFIYPVIVIFWSIARFVSRMK
ncbi:hypothetical protein HF895_06510 [Bacteroides sp. AN502]|nr:hypothetical protein [Caecibacteroides pullorum]MDC6281349.1 hypothetical protein [Caecibacteroides pullorum]